MTIAQKISAKKTSDHVSRRALLTGGLAGGFLLAFHLPLRAVNEPLQPPDATDGKFAPNAFIRIDVTGHTTLVMPQVEMGQGVYTAVAMILAEELDADFSQVTLQHAPPNDKLYGNPTFGLQVTGNSNSIRAFWKPLRNAGAGARAMLVRAAAQQWQVEPATCSTANSEVAHKESGRKLSYGALALAASSQTPPKDVALKEPKDFALIGKPLSAPRQQEILLVDFASPTQALVKVRVRIDTILYLDYLAYHCIDGAWLITAKSFHVERRYEQAPT